MVLIGCSDGIGQGFDAPGRIAMAVPGKELGEWIVSRCKVRIHYGPDQLHVDLLLAKGFEAVNVNVVQVHVGNGLAFVFNATSYGIAF